MGRAGATRGSWGLSAPSFSLVRAASQHKVQRQAAAKPGMIGMAVPRPRPCRRPGALRPAGPPPPTAPSELRASSSAASLQRMMSSRRLPMEAEQRSMAASTVALASSPPGITLRQGRQSRSSQDGRVSTREGPPEPEGGNTYVMLPYTGRHAEAEDKGQWPRRPARSKQIYTRNSRLGQVCRNRQTKS